MIRLGLQCINRQPNPPCPLTNLHVFTVACSIPFLFRVIPYLSSVFSVSPTSYVFPSFSGSLFLSPPLTLVNSLLSCSLSFHSAYENRQSSVFSFLPPPEAYAITFLFYLILRLVLDPLCSSHPQRSSVFSLTPSASRQ